jgi:serine phosphatase RsbU (regulator of sigma subunit)
VPLPPGGTLIAYTDGLVETRSDGLDKRLEQLRSAAAAQREQSLDGLVSSITDALIPNGSDDDVALLAIRRSAVDH